MEEHSHEVASLECLQATSRDLAEADKERQARRTHLQRAMLDLRSQQASELARDLLTAERPRVTAAEMRRPASSEKQVARRPLRRAASARTARDRRPLPQWMQQERNRDFEDVDNYELKVRKEKEEYLCSAILVRTQGRSHHGGHGGSVPRVHGGHVPRAPYHVPPTSK